MKKFFIALLAITLVASLFTIAAAEDKLSLSGTMRVRAWDVENYSDFDDGNKADEQSYWDQRMRIGGAIKANDAVSGHFRLDFSESQWGSSSWTGSRYGSSGSTPIQVDRAYLQIVQDLYTLKAGQLYFSTGPRYIVYDNNTTGITATLKLPVVIDLHYSKLDEDQTEALTPAGISALTDEDPFTTEDLDAFVVQAKYAADTWSVGGFYALIEDSSILDNSPEAFGVFGSVALGPVNLVAEIDIFGGDASPTVEYMGEQVFINAEWKMDTLILGGDIYYAAAADPNEIQLEGLNNFGDFQPTTYGAFVEDYVPFPGSGVHDFTGDSAGVTGASIYAKFSPMEKLTLWGQVAYLEPEEDENTSIDDLTVLNLSAQYEFVPSATIAALYSTSLVSTDSGTVPDDDATTLAARLQIKF
ncbi:MAG: hypothetical protein JSW04_08555 [Desulfobacterales bacterium]|nr:MAG: hypothetical protein JSW04_08555 [Desulfobacterales bacterium]